MFRTEPRCTELQNNLRKPRYSCDRESDIPAEIPAQVRLAWLMTGEDDLPPAGMGLTFRVRRLRRQAQTRVEDVRVCPEEDGVQRKVPVTCERCGLCWRPLPGEPQQRIALPVLSR